MKLRTFLFVSSLLFALSSSPSIAMDIDKPDDTVRFDLSAENWVTTKTAKVVVAIEAAASSANSGAMRTTMIKAIDEAIKAEWRLINFNRIQDSTGMERWSAQYEARVSESDLSGLHDKLKKISKAGMQLSVQDIQFTPTLEETQAVETQLRTQIYKMANEQLSVLNATIPNRNYRISEISFRSGMRNAQYAQRAMQQMAMAKQEMLSTDDGSGNMAAEPMERAQKLTLSAVIALASVPPTATK